MCCDSVRSVSLQWGSQSSRLLRRLFSANIGSIFCWMAWWGWRCRDVFYSRYFRITIHAYVNFLMRQILWRELFMIRIRHRVHNLFLFFSVLNFIRNLSTFSELNEWNSFRTIKKSRVSLTACAVAFSSRPRLPSCYTFCSQANASQTYRTRTRQFAYEVAGECSTHRIMQLPWRSLTEHSLRLAPITKSFSKRVWQRSI